MTSALLLGVVVSSVIGSVHCMAMCGPLIGLHGGAGTVRLALVHSLGRGVTYVILGALAGLAGSALDVAGELADVQRLATILAALVLVGIGIVQIVRPQAWTRGSTSSLFGDALVRIRSRSEVRRAALLGTLTGLLPCGWLWAFVVMAAGAGSPLGGAFVMGAFWLGTVPAMVGVLGFAGPLLSRIGARMPALTAIVLIVVGLGTLAVRWRDAGASQVETPHCHARGPS